MTGRSNRYGRTSKNNDHFAWSGHLVSRDIGHMYVNCLAVARTMEQALY